MDLLGNVLVFTLIALAMGVAVALVARNVRHRHLHSVRLASALWVLFVTPTAITWNRSTGGSEGARASGLLLLVLLLTWAALLVWAISSPEPASARFTTRYRVRGTKRGAGTPFDAWFDAATPDDARRAAELEGVAVADVVEEER